MKKYLFVALIILVITGLWAYRVSADSSGPSGPGTMADDATVGGQAWANPDNAKIEDGTLVKSAMDFAFYVDKFIKIVKSDGSIGTTNKADTTTHWGTLAYATYGSSRDLWGETWSSSDINDVDFGVVVSATDGGGLNFSHYLKATNFGFSIPAGALIRGIVVEVKKQLTGSGPLSAAGVDYIRISVYYGTQLQIQSGTVQVRSGKIIIK